MLMKFLFKPINREIVCGIASEENCFITVEGDDNSHNKYVLMDPLVALLILT
jgi:hypothetical protein